MCAPSRTVIRKRNPGDPSRSVGLGDIATSVPAPADKGGTVSAPVATAAPAPSSAPSIPSGGARTGGSMRYIPPGGDATPYGPVGGDVVRGGGTSATTPTTPIARPGGDVVSLQGRTKKKATVDILRSGILSTVRSAGAGSLANLFQPGATAGAAGGKDKLGQ